jgi:hypothetical protein
MLTMDTLRVERKHGCIITYGSMPIPTMMQLIEEAGVDALLDAALARRLNASMVVGVQDDLDQLNKDPEILDVIKNNIAGKSKSFNVPESAIIWLESGDRGLSSETIFYFMTKMPIIEADDISHPHDTSDLARCRLLLEAVPEFDARRAELGAISNHWRALINNWEMLCMTMDKESPNWRKREGHARDTYKLMVSLYEEFERF